MPTAAQRKAAADLLASARARTARARLCLDGDLLDEHQLLVEELGRARKDDERLNEPDRAPAIAEQILELEDRIAAAETEFVFKAMGRGSWRKLVADHPPTPEQLAVDPQVDNDVEVFPFEAMAASLEEPALTAADLRKLHDDVLDETQFQKLWTTCLVANLGTGVNRPESAAARSVLAANARPKSEQPSDSESLEAS